jgi:hypothetical protein
MPVSVTLETVHARILATVRREVTPSAVGSACRPALDKVWEFIRGQPALWTNGHSVFLDQYPNQPGEPIACDLGVGVTGTFETTGEVYATETPSGEAAVTVHHGPHDPLKEAHRAAENWLAANQRESTGTSGKPTEIPHRIQPTASRPSCTS